MKTLSYALNCRPKSRGFTLIEILIVIGVMAIIGAVVFVALNPAARFQDARNNTRRTDVTNILSAIKIDQVDNGGAYMDDIESLSADNYYQIGSGSSCNTTCSNPTVILQAECIDLSSLVSEGRLPSIPFDPNSSSGASAEASGYYLVKMSNGTMAIGSCHEEQGSADAIPQISASR